MSDEIFKSRFTQEGDQFIRWLTQPTEDMILERNKQLRDNPGSLKDMKFGRLVASIPMNLWEGLMREFPDFNRYDNATRGKIINRYLETTDLGRACKVRDDSAKSATKYHEVLV